MEIRNFPENQNYEKRPEIVHYEGEARRESPEVLEKTDQSAGFAPEKPFLPVSQPSFVEAPATTTAPEISQTESEVRNIMHLAEEKGVEAAVKEVRGDEPAVIDAVHDRLVEKLRENTD